MACGLGRRSMFRYNPRSQGSVDMFCKQVLTGRYVLASAGLVVGLVFGVCGGLVIAQQSGSKRTVLTNTNDPGSEAYGVTMAAVEIAAASNAGKHFHNGLEITAVTEGSVVVEVQGKPAQTFKAGEAFFVDPTVPHDARNNGSAPVKLIGVYV